jgi:ATP-dependent helicase/nuclease subunit A
MGSGVLTRYNASAGSGKTYKLTGIYISKLFSSRNSYKKILAVTFTNKAASEMKRKILSQLNSLTEGKDTEFLRKISDASGKPEEEIRSGANQILHSILHDYSSFSVGTIDSFFQKVLKAFSREIGLNHGYIIELDHSLILRHAVEAMLASTSEDPALREWITEYSYERAEGGKGWNLEEDILKLAEEIFREKFRLIPVTERNKLKDRAFLIEYSKEMKSVQTDFSRKLQSCYKACTNLLEKHNVTDEMFFRGARGGVPSFLKMITEGVQSTWKPPTATVSQVLETPPVWTSKSGPSPQLKNALDDGFGELFTECLRYYNENFIPANTAIFISENIYILGILSNILEQVHLITSSENRFLLSDAGELLWLIIKEDQTPFIYEKTGNQFDNFMIDEFQDTSHIQWNNFRPLIENSMAEGKDNLVAGDVKQSIYRWRNSDWKILKSVLNEQIRDSGLKDEYLDTNWRSSSNIISFNNSLFTVLPRLIDRSEKNNTGSLVLEDLYTDAVQKYPGKKDGGYVRIEFIEDDEKPFSETALSRLPGIIEELQDRGYSGSDIGILVRTNREGASVLNMILEYREAADNEKRSKYNYNVISSESLLLSTAPSVSFIMALLHGLYEDDNRLSLALMLRNWMFLSGSDPNTADMSDVESETERLFPEGYREFLKDVRQMTLFEAVEKIILFFKLGGDHGNTAYLSSFQDCVLEYSGAFSADIPSFLEWWENNGARKSVVVSDQPDSIRVMTIHKSKGLEFRAVIIPFISWSMGHGSSGPALWVNPANSPFNKLGIVPVRYKADLQYSEFAGEYFNETYNSLVDNTNLLYVAFTRAVDCLYGFCPSKGKSGTISTMLREAFFSEDQGIVSSDEIKLKDSFDPGTGLFMYGKLPENQVKKKTGDTGRIAAGSYYVNHGINRLHLKFHGENWLQKAPEERKNRINYGLVMHEILESVKVVDDIPEAIRNMLMQGRIAERDEPEILERMSKAMSRPEVKEWFLPGLKVMNETEILTADGTARRPDRVIVADDRVIIIDFKFGKEKNQYLKQVKEYSELIKDIENKPVEAYLWYIDNDKIVKV